MSRKWIAGLGLVAALALPLTVFAHGGHTHKVMGTVASLDGNHFQVKGTDGKTVVITLDTKTAITRGKTRLDARALKVGERVAVDYTQDKNINTATAVRLGTAPAQATK
jgi:hypothetical protein